jgi:hypothetical protein
MGAPLKYLSTMKCVVKWKILVSPGLWPRLDGPLGCVYMRQVERQVKWAGYLLQATCYV